MTYIIIGIIIIGLLFFIVNGKKTKSDQDDFFISTASQSSVRIEKLGLNEATEDVSHILDESQLQIPEIKNKEKRIEYKPDSNREWIIDLVIPNGTIIKQEKLYELFDLEWRKNFTSTIFGHSPEDNRWTYACGRCTTNFQRNSSSNWFTRCF
ncbi:hypothetical protein [Algibacter lectus]|nr:hypothetical protein [Algibacter lectus]